MTDHMHSPRMTQTEAAGARCNSVLHTVAHWIAVHHRAFLNTQNRVDACGSRF